MSLQTKRLSLVVLGCLVIHTSAFGAFIDWFTEEQINQMGQQVIQSIKDNKKIISIGLATFFVGYALSTWRNKQTPSKRRSKTKDKNKEAGTDKNNESNGNASDTDTSKKDKKEDVSKPDIKMVSLGQAYQYISDALVGKVNQGDQEAIYDKIICYINKYANDDTISELYVDLTIKQVLQEYRFNKAADRIHHGIKIIDHSNATKKQLNVTCGYNTAFNAAMLYWYVLDELENPLLDERLNKGPDIDALKKMIDDWQKALMNSNKRNESHSDYKFEDIDESAIAYLITHAGFGIDVIPACDLTIIPNILQFDATLDARWPTTVRNLHYGNINAHIFLVADMQVIVGADGSDTRTGGHWVAVVAVKKGSQIELHVADSLVNKHHRRGIVSRLAQHLTMNPEELQLIADIHHLIDKAKIQLTVVKNPVSCLDTLSGVLNDVNERGLLCCKAFTQRYKPLIQDMLNTMQKTVLTDPHRTQLVRLLSMLEVNQTAL